VTTTFLLVRHAAHDWLGRGLAGRLPGVELNEEGRQQARGLVQRLEGVPVDAIYCSPQPRTRQTAQPLAAARRLPFHVHAAFDEIDFGQWTGRSFDQLSADGAAWSQWVERRGSAQPPGGEPFAEVPRRAMEGLHRLRAEHPDRQVLVVSHGDVIKAIVASCLGLSLDRLESLEIVPASVSVLALGAEWSQLKLLNAQSALR
jgi:broad specificity phosphatase PhoE